MLLVKYRKLIVIGVVLAFLGQSLAMAAPHCQSDEANSSSQDMAMVGMDHSMHSTAEEKAKSDNPVSQTSDCCDQDCDCPMSACSAVALSNAQYRFSSVFLEINSSPATASPLAYLSTSLYRPPILL